ncbi:pantetheine-phosphate adenylyltransferase [Candidatus Pacearchaeota archaeon]|nr:pantetheine-phosphate adenylyltransferase [Candidatus Pacearchaeota archaeon]
MVNKKSAIYPLSGDPVHNGHIHTLKYAADSDFFDKIYFAIGVNPFKKTLFNLEERIMLANKAVSAAGLSNRVEVVGFEGLLRNYATSNGIGFIVRGYRDGKDAEYESGLANFNAGYGLKTWLVPAKKEVADISSSVVKAVVSEFGLVHDLVHPAVKQALEEKLRGVTLLGVTGNMGAGKTTFCKSLVDYSSKNGGPEISHIDFDQLVHSLYFGSSPMSCSVRDKIKESFGENIFDENGLNRKKLAGIVFGDESKRTELARILSVPSLVLLEQKLREMNGMVLVDAAYFTEYNMLPLVNYNMIFLSCDDNERYRRILERDKMGPEEVRAKTSAQHPQDLKRSLILSAQARQQHGFFYEVDTTTSINFPEVLAKIQAHFQVNKSEVKQ